MGVASFKSMPPPPRLSASSTWYTGSYSTHEHTAWENRSSCWSWGNDSLSITNHNAHTRPHQTTLDHIRPHSITSDYIRPHRTIFHFRLQSVHIKSHHSTYISHNDRWLHT